MNCSKEILTRNPEYYTAWNERKRSIQLLNPESLIKSELMINILAIKANPKSYSAWYHRRWFIENYCSKETIQKMIVEGELKLLEQLLDLDCRNCKDCICMFCIFDLFHSSWLELSNLVSRMGKYFCY